MLLLVYLFSSNKLYEIRSIFCNLHTKGIRHSVGGFDPESGEIVQLERVSNEPGEMARALEGLEGPLYGVMESGTNAWAMYREFVSIFERLTVVDPSSVWDRKSDRRAKTDRLDAMRMAQMLYRGQIKGLYIPDEVTQDLRVLVRGKVRMSRWVTRLTSEIGSMLRSWGYVGNRSLLSKSGKARMDKAELPKHSAELLKLWGELLDKAQEIEDKLQATIEEEAANDPECAILQTIPGVGAFTALLVRAEVGDIARFPKAKNLVSYIGLSPRVFQSGESSYYGGLGNWGNRWLRYALGLLAQRVAASKRQNCLRQTYWRVSFKRHRNEAKIAVARKAARIIHGMLSEGEVWDESKHRREKAAA
jgi:transposase